MKKKTFIFSLILMLIVAFSANVYAETERFEENVQASASASASAKKKAAARKAYKRLIAQYEKKYGKAKICYHGVQYWQGLCFARLLDFNKDGVEELVLAYQKEKYDTDKVKYYVELWTYNGKKAQRVVSMYSWTGNNSPIFGGLSIVKYKGKYYLNLTNMPKDYYYGAKGNGKIGLVHKFVWKGDLMNGNWYYNGKSISTDRYINFYSNSHRISTTYSFSSQDKISLIKNQTARTKKILK